MVLNPVGLTVPAIGQVVDPHRSVDDYHLLVLNMAKTRLLKIALPLGDAAKLAHLLLLLQLHIKPQSYIDSRLLRSDAAAAHDLLQHPVVNLDVRSHGSTYV